MASKCLISMIGVAELALAAYMGRVAVTTGDKWGIPPAIQQDNAFLL
jgi:hypothetical protein